MTRREPLGSLDGPLDRVAAVILRRTRSGTGTVLVWVDGAEIFASDVSSPLARRVERDRPSLMVGVYTSLSKSSDIVDDIQQFAVEMAA